MRNVLQACRKNPTQKFEAIQEFSKDLFKQKALKDWGISIEAEPITIQSTILPMPVINLKGGDQSSCNEQTLRRLGIQKAENLLHERWMLVYEAADYNNANNVFNTFKAASKTLGIKVEDPTWIELGSFKDSSGF
jgi:hypothetical protein